MSSRQGEEKLKKLALGGVAQDRSDAAFTTFNSDSKSPLLQLLSKDVFQPSLEDVLATNSTLKSYLRSGRVKVLIPMRELQPNIAPIIGELLDTLTDYIGIENIFIANNGLHEKVKESVVSRGVTLISVEKIKERFDFPRLLDILSLKTLNFGLGFSMMSGIAYLALENIMKPDDWLVKFDGDIANFRQCLLPDYLFYPLILEPETEWDHLKISKVGRNNETVMAGVNSLLPYFCSQIKEHNFLPQAQVAEEIYEACIRQIWILSGQYAIRWKHIYKQLAATGYCDPLLMSIQQGWRNFAQIVNPHPLLDMPNTKQKEDCMMTRLVQFLNALVFFGKSVRNEWNLEEISSFNRDIAQYQNSVVWIPEEPGSLHLENIECDRLFPSIEVLIREGLLE